MHDVETQRLRILASATIADLKHDCDGELCRTTQTLNEADRAKLLQPAGSAAGIDGPVNDPC